MGRRTHSYPLKTKMELYALSGNQCMFYDCNCKLFPEGYSSNQGEICHIYGLNPGSARYSEEIDEEFLNSFDNLILLCPNHHKLVDSNELVFTPPLLIRMREDHFKKVNSIMSDSISFNQCQYNDNAEIIQNNLLNYYGLETSIDEIIKVENVFSKQSNDTKKVFEKIIEVMHRNNEYISRRESGMINMMSVVSELSKGYGRNEDRIVSAIVLLERQGYIEEQEYNEFNYNSYRESSDGTFIDLSRDYYYRIQNGRWFMTMSGMILDACYTQQGYL